MRVDFTGRHYTLDDEVKDFASKKLEKLVRFLAEPAEAHVILEVEKNREIAELVVTHRLGVLQAKEEAETMLNAIQAAVDKVEKQARRSRKKMVDKRRRSSVKEDHHWPLEVIEATTVAAGEKPRVIKTTRLPIKPMTIDEAALELERSKNEFFVFRDSRTDKVSVLYRRRDSHLGLIAPEP